MPYLPKKINRFYRPEKKDFGNRSNDYSKFYNSRKWRKKSKQIRNKYKLCQCKECKELNRQWPADVTDHIKGLTYIFNNNLDPFDDNELMAMNSKCHNKKSGKQRHGK